MSESEDDAAPRQQQHHHVDVREVLMDFDIEMDSSWPLDQIAFINAAGVNHHPNHPMSPILFSASDQPCSPLWAFCDAVENDDKFAQRGGGGGGVGGGQVNGSAVADSSPRLLSSCDSHSIAEKPSENGDTKANSSPFSGLPPEHTEAYYRIKERMTQALRKFKDSTDQHVLAQVWAPVKNGCRYFLTTYGQPFVLDPDSNGLHQYRMASLMYKFSVDGGESNEELGLPGRVFRQKLPEWTPNVQYYSIREYPRLDHALNFNVRGSLALPVFEPSGQYCVGVVELIMTSEKINYAPEVDKVCKALEAVNLRSAEIVDHTPTRICNEGRQSALTEILEILTAACETLKLPMAQTWVPCMHRNVLAHGGGLKKICTSIDASCMGRVCMSTNDVAFYIVDPRMWGFRGACLEHHLQKDQGVAGRAFSSRDSCFCGDITQFGKNDYPLVHYAKMFDLTGSFAICLESVYTGNDNYVLEFFLPTTAAGPAEQRRLLGSLLATMKKHLRSLKVVSGAGIDDEFYVEVVAASLTAGLESTVERIPIVHSNVGSPVAAPATNGVAEIVMRRETPRPGPALLLGNGEFENGGSDNVVIVEGGSNANNNNNNNNNNNLTAPESREAKKPSERKRGKTEKSISLEVLQQYFAGSLKDAAKSLGVCPTTMKRICRQHGISRWPSRKINKVNRSLTKLKRVIESVQGAEGAFSLSPLAATSPIPSNSRPSTSNGTNHQTSPIHSPFDQQPLLDRKESPAHSSPRSGGGPHEIGFGLCNNNGSHNVKPSCSREASVGTPTSHGSCQGSPVNNTNGAIVVKADLSPESGLRPLNDHLFSIPDPIAGPLHEPQDSFGAMLVEDAGSSKDLRNLCPAEAVLDEQVAEQYGWINLGLKQASTSNNNNNNNFIVPQSMVNDISKVKRQMRSVTIKARYREDIIRFRVSLGSSIIELNEEVAKRLKLDMGTFDMKYMDDDREWVLIACEADLMECMDVCQSSGSNMIRLLIHDIMPNLGSSCESTE